MKLRNKTEIVVLLLGDIAFLLLALAGALYLRFGYWPDQGLLKEHLVPFIIIFGLWLIVFYIFDLYRPLTWLTKEKLSAVLFRALTVNTVLAAIFFYLVPYFYIQPKLVLVLVLVLAFVFLWLWRHWMTRYFIDRPGESVLLVGRQEDFSSLIKTLSGRQLLQFKVCSSQSLIKDDDGYSTIVLNWHGYDRELLLRAYKKFKIGRRVIGINDLYEEWLGFIPVDLISEKWFLEHVPNQPKPIYDSLKRVVDVIVASLLLIIFAPFILLTAVAILIFDGQPLFYLDKRVGRFGRVFYLYKFRSMTNDQVTTIGRFLRQARLDELPQLVNVLQGRLSLIGPRPEKPDYVGLYSRQIPYYDIRHLIAPGLSGWAQIYHDGHPHFKPKVEATRDKLSYDLYYVKNRSLWLDLKISLKTLITLMSFSGK